MIKTMSVEINKLQKIPGHCEDTHVKADIFRAILVAYGYNQIPGIDFTERNSPLMNDVSFRIILIGMIIWNLEVKIFDIETAFFHGDSMKQHFHRYIKWYETGKR
jgi:hypothetical protein